MYNHFDCIYWTHLGNDGIEKLVFCEKILGKRGRGRQRKIKVDDSLNSWATKILYAPPNSSIHRMTEWDGRW